MLARIVCRCSVVLSRTYWRCLGVLVMFVLAGGAGWWWFVRVGEVCVLVRASCVSKRG